MRLPRRRGVGGAGVGGGLGPSLLSSPSGLERLDEEDDDDLEFELGDVFDSHRALKRRKLSDVPAAPIRTLYGYVHGHGHGRTSQTSMAGKMDVDVSRTPTRRSLSSKFKLAFTTHLIGHKDALIRANDHDDDDSDADMDMDTIMSMHPHLDSPLQHRSRRAFASGAVAPLLSVHTLNVKPLAARLARSRSKSKSMSKPVKRRASNAKRTQQQHNTQICRPMGKLRMSSDS
ncbi:hypothetical protein CPB84DRAFT_1801208 [Gymnopilus junonius]|uniref:Uncharacterized protein n=1 Tax=Gymnopilus junonius TaxID=109634 RepID=A0A9P5N9F6_GYMJU|nr:hypothetical protein CPB84DRAFT_1801208 [Gymnopilus junonius]